MRAVGKTPNGFKSIRISSHTPKNIQEGSAEIICEDIDILSNPKILRLSLLTILDHLRQLSLDYLTLCSTIILDYLPLPWTAILAYLR